MIVEDEAIVLMDMAMMVEELGFDVHSECSTLSEALKAIEGDRPDAALLDINIRTELIWPVARALKDKDCKLVFTSADARHPELKGEFADCGFVEKPASVREIEEALRKALAAE